MKKRILSIVIVLTMLTSFIPIVASAATSGTCGDNLTWTLDDEGTLTISGTGAMTNWLGYLSVPWDSSRGSIRKAIIGDSVTTISNGAFDHCSNLTSVVIPYSVTTIGDGAFYSCSLLKSVTIGDSVTTIGNRAFEYCGSLESVTIGDSVTTIGDMAFCRCSSLERITIPDSVTTIGSSAFTNCSSLESVTIGDSVTTIGDYAFGFCSSLESVTIPDSVTTIGDWAFHHCSSLESVTIPGSVTTIGAVAFGYCSSLTDVYYTGSASDWAKISIGSNNDPLTNATIHYNYVSFNDMFKESAYEYNHSLARVTFDFVEAGFSAVEEWEKGGNDTSPIAKKRYANIKNKYDEYGFTVNQKFYNYGIKLTDTTDKAAYSIASRDITVDGKTKRIVALVVRGKGYGGEWVSNFNVGSDNTYSQGFKKPADDITNKLKSYISADKSKDVILWITGYSRGAAIANLVAANMDNYAESCSYLDAKDIFAYTFATPRPVHVDRADADNEKYGNIFNIVNPADVVPQVLLSKWGYGRYGVTKTMFTTVPSQVKTYYKNLTGDKYSVPANQKETISEMISILHKIVGSKNNFNETYQGIIQDIVYWHFVYKELDVADKSLLAALSKRHSPNAAYFCYEESKKIIKAYLDAFEKFGINLEKHQEMLAQVGAACELNDTSFDEVLRQILGELSGKSINAISVINLLDTGFSALNAYNSVEGNFNELFTTHEPNTYKAWLFGLDNPDKIYIKGNETAELLDTNANKYKTQLIQCPVDVEVTDSEGNVVVSVVNHEILIDELPVVVIDDKIKIFYYDNFDNYNVNITAYEDGEVNYYVSEYATGEEETKRVCYNNIEVSANDTLTGSMNDEIDTDVANYDLTLLENSISNTEILTEDNLENLSVEVSVEGSGTAPDVLGVSKGDYITLTANPFVGAEFIGWYNGEECISEDKEYSFVIDTNYELCAKFTVSAAEISDVTIPQISDGTITNKATITANEDVEGVLKFTAYDDETVVTEYICNVEMNKGDETEFESQFADDGNINRITACLYDTNDIAMTYEISADVVRELPVGENDEYKYIVYSDDTIKITEIKTTVGKTFEIPATIDGHSVYAIGSNLFAQNTDVTEITLPATVSEIDTSAFSGCENLEWINFYGSAEEWNCVTFLGDDALPESVSVATDYTNMPAGIKSIDFAYENENLYVTVGLDYVKESGVVYFAVYDSEGRFISVISKTVAVADTEVTFNLGENANLENCEIKVFCWDNNINPLSDLYNEFI